MKKTTLITGSIRITAFSGSGRSVPLRPGEQAQLSTISEITQIKKITVQTSDIIAWKNGIFNFNGLDVRAVMAQLARWYDVDIHYEGAMPSNIFKGEMYRSAKLSFVLDGLRKMGIKCRVDGKTLIVGQ